MTNGHGNVQAVDKASEDAGSYGSVHNYAYRVKMLTADVTICATAVSHLKACKFICNVSSKHGICL